VPQSRGLTRIFVSAARADLLGLERGQPTSRQDAAHVGAWAAVVFADRRRQRWRVQRMLRGLGNGGPHESCARGARHRASPSGRAWPRPVTRAASASSNAPPCDTSPCHQQTQRSCGGRYRSSGKCLRLGRGRDLRQALSSQAKGTFYMKRSRSANQWRKPGARACDQATCTVRRSTGQALVWSAPR
jgi:hypothetical protein